MAEAFGVAGSAVGIISLALQLGEGISKLRDFWKAVKDAPEEILDILDELESTHEVLKEIEHNLGNQTISPAATRSLGFCQKGMNILHNAVKELDGEMRKRKKWGGVKMVMKKELLEKMEKRLGRASSLMIMAHQNYTASLSKSRHDEQVKLAMLQFSEIVDIRTTLHNFNLVGSTSIVQQQTSNNKTPTSPNTVNTKGTSSNSGTTNSLSKHQKILNAKLRLPFFSGVWEICGYRQSISGWAFTLKTYNVVPVDAPIFRLARRGDVVGMQQLFQTRQASPFDVDSRGKTLLFTAATKYRHQACEFLINQGVDPNAEDDLGELPLLVSISDSWGIRQPLPILECLLPRMECDVISTLSNLHTYRCNYEVLKRLLHSTESPIHERSCRERALLVLTISRWSSTFTMNMKSFMWLALAGMNMETCVQNMEQQEFFIFLLNTLYNLGKITTLFFKPALKKIFITKLDVEDGNVAYKDLLKDQCSLVNDILFAGSKVYDFGIPYNSYDRSLLLKLLQGILKSPVFRESKATGNDAIFGSNLMDLVKIWLDLLASTGIDLVIYGQWETSMCRGKEKHVGHIDNRHKAHQYNRIDYLDYLDYTDCPDYLSLLTFTYGPKISDWQFWFTLDPIYIYNGYFLQFWDMVDPPERPMPMPGAWNFDI